MKILCPNHEDTRPSMEVYENENERVGFCFVCHTRVVLDGPPSNNRRSPTNIRSALEYISTLPVERIRGFDLPVDSVGYYVLWPTRDFYKRRNFHDNPRYTSPRGVKAPLYEIKGKTETLVIVEGELNALSLSVSTKTDDTIVSPGSVANFGACLKVAKEYKRIVLVVDHDPAGIVYGCALKLELLKLGKRVSLITCETDYNEMYCNLGPVAVQGHFWRNQ